MLKTCSECNPGFFYIPFSNIPAEYDHANGSVTYHAAAVWSPYDSVVYGF